MGWTPAANHTHSYVWHDGVMTDLGTFGGPSTVAQDINDRGQVVGFSQAPSREAHAFIWQDGAITDLGTLGGDYARAEAINERGQVVGQSWTASGETHGFLWEGGTMTDLGDIGTQGRLISINEDGQIMGNRSATGMDQQAFIWHDGVMTDVGETSGGRSNLAKAMNAGGQVTGWGYAPGPADARTFLWGDGTPTDLGTRTIPWDINDKGQIVGGGPPAFLWQDGVIIDLKTLGGATMALDVNETGMAVGVSASSTPSCGRGSRFQAAAAASTVTPWQWRRVPPAEMTGLHDVVVSGSHTRTKSEVDRVAVPPGGPSPADGARRAALNPRLEH